jgi:hypothetical protein
MPRKVSKSRTKVWCATNRQQKTSEIRKRIAEHEKAGDDWRNNAQVANENASLSDCPGCNNSTTWLNDWHG